MGFWDLGFGLWALGFLMKVIVGITGATGVIYGVRLLQRLREAHVETHLVISKWGARTLLHETPFSREQVEALATEVYAPTDMGAAIASGQFPSVQWENARGERARLRRTPLASSTRRYLEGATPPAALGARSAAERDSPG